MRTLSIALLTTADAAVDITAIGSGNSNGSHLAGNHSHGPAHPSWWDTIFRHWPEGTHPPRLEILTEDCVAERHESSRTPVWDAVVLTMNCAEDEACVCRVLDMIQQAQIPALLLVSGDQGARLEAFHPGSVLVRSLDADANATAAMLYAMASRQAAVRGIDQNLRLAQSFQGETAAEIDRLHQELLLAARVQRDFMPKHMPEVEGVEAGVLFRPAGFVSGDTYDVYRLDEHHVGFLIADAMGHGVPAALMTLYISGSLPRKELDVNEPCGYRIVPPGVALTRLNNSLQECLAGPARFVTAICGIIDIRTGLIRIACAGHPAPLRVGPRGVRPVDVSGMLLGVVGDYEYEEVTFTLEHDEMLVLHSDGIEQAFGPRTPAAGDNQGHTPVPHMLHIAAMGRSAGEAIDVSRAIKHFAADLDSQSGSLHQDDDLTVLALKTHPVGSRPRRVRDETAEAELEAGAY